VELVDAIWNEIPDFRESHEPQGPISLPARSIEPATKTPDRRFFVSARVVDGSDDFTRDRQNDGGALQVAHAPASSSRSLPNARSACASL
jgi:hypothetical protein